MPRTTPLPFARPDLSQAEKDAVNRVLDSGWLTQGKESELFEQEFAVAVNSPNAIAVNSATAALHLGLLGMGINEGEAVIVPALTFTATAEVVHRCGAIPLIVDVDRNTYLLTPAVVARFLAAECERDDRGWVHTKTGLRIRGVICVHYGGRSCDLDGLIDLCRNEGFFLGEDAAHAYGSLYKGNPIGQHSDFCAFSFYATKNITTGEGGILTTPHTMMAHRLRRLRLHGIETPAYRRKNYYYDVVDEGYKYNISDLSAALGRVQIQRHDSMLLRRRRIHEIYSANFASLEGIRACPEYSGSSHHLYTIEIDPELANRDDFAAMIEAQNIRTGLHFIPLYRFSHYRKRYQHTYKLADSNLSLEEEWQLSFPASEQIFSRLLSLPIYSSMNDQDITDVVDVVKNVYDQLQLNQRKKNPS